MWTFSTIFMRLLSRQSKGADAAAVFLSALAFLTRIPCASAPMNMSAGLLWFGFIGAVIGGCCVGAAMPFWIALPKSSPALSCIAAGWIYVAVEAWLSRGMHWDGAADMADALGSRATGENFWRVLKDSRTGAFGVMALIILMALQACAAALHWETYSISGCKALAPLILAPAWARLAPIWLGASGRPHGKSGLGALICGKVSTRCRIGAYIQGGIIFLICLFCGTSVWALGILFLAQILINKYFLHLGRLHGGISGDFFGCQIEAMQTIFLLLSCCA